MLMPYSPFLSNRRLKNRFHVTFKQILSADNSNPRKLPIIQKTNRTNSLTKTLNKEILIGTCFAQY